MDGTLTCTTILDQSGPGGNSNERVLQFPELQKWNLINQMGGLIQQWTLILHIMRCVQKPSKIKMNNENNFLQNCLLPFNRYSSEFLIGQGTSETSLFDMVELEFLLISSVFKN